MKLNQFVADYLQPISPLAWHRVATQLLPYFQHKYAWSISELFQASESLHIDEEDLARIRSTVAELYQIDLPAFC